MVIMNVGVRQSESTNISVLTATLCPARRIGRVCHLYACQPSSFRARMTLIIEAQSRDVLPCVVQAISYIHLQQCHVHTWLIDIGASPTNFEKDHYAVNGTSELHQDVLALFLRSGQLPGVHPNVQACSITRNRALLVNTIELPLFAHHTTPSKVWFGRVEHVIR